MIAPLEEAEKKVVSIEAIEVAKDITVRPSRSLDGVKRVINSSPTRGSGE